jgi:hypothetical protein
LKAIVTIDTEFEEVEVHEADRYTVGEHAELILQVHQEKEYLDREGNPKKYDTYVDVTTYAPGMWDKVELVD